MRSQMFPRSVFSKRCFDLITSKLAHFPLELKHYKDTGWGVYTTRDITRREKILFEDPIVDLNDASSAWFSELCRDATKGTIFPNSYDPDLSDFGMFGVGMFGVARMIKISASELPERPSEHVNWKGLSWVVDEGGKPFTDSSVEKLNMEADIVGRMLNLNYAWWDTDEYALMKSKWRSNAIQSSLYLGASKFNHSCSGNIAWSPSNPMTILIAIKPIKKGEQLYYTYYHLDPDTSGEQRRAKLKDRFGFGCNCELCLSGK
jgi:hypothetical protein